VTQGYDAYGHVLTVTDSATKLAYWKLTDVDNAGRYKTEMFGNGVSSTRSYFADKQSLQSIVTSSGTTAVQNLAYDYDARRDLTSRTDTLQPQDTTERFRYDPIERLTCAYFSVAENDTAPCALGYGYDPSGNGNLTSKSDVGMLAYGDPMHPHAATNAGDDSFGYDAVGNQIARPAGATVSYTPFDLPKTITQSSGTVTLAYDGDEQRIRKITPAAETLYFGDLYERVTTVAPASTAHQYYVHSPERVVAVVTQGGAQAGTVYVHVDHLGSVDVLTNASGAVVERRSYDPFGQRRNPVWGQPPPASFASMTTVGFTGQESDDELGLVNMKGRIYDPKVGRFLTTDPIVSEPLSAQSWNPYSYVANNPLNYVDPTGFDAEAEALEREWDEYQKSPKGQQILRNAGSDCSGSKCGPKPVEGPPVAVQAGAARSPVDVSTTGSSAGYVPQPVTTSPKSTPAGIAAAGPTVGDRLYAVGQVLGGFFAGIPLGLVPGGALGQQAAVAAGALDPGSRGAQIGLAVGELFGGAVLSAGGVSGEVAGFLLSDTGIGAFAGVPVVVVSTAAVAVGAANVWAGAKGLAEALQSRGSGEGTNAAREGAQGPSVPEGKAIKVDRGPDGLSERGRPLTPEQARTAVDNGQDVYAHDRATAREVAGKRAAGPETHPAKGETRFEHFHRPNRAGGHIFFGEGEE
jgi:RHS repeat-associated protein